MQITRSNLKLLRERLGPILGDLGNEIGLNMSLGNASFARDGSSGHFKLELAAVTDSGEVLDPKREALKEMGPMYGIPDGKLFEPFEFMGDKFVLVGFNGRATRFPFVAKKLNSGKLYKLPSVAVEKLKAA